MIRTVLGDISNSNLGKTYCHEHLIMDLSHIRKENDSVLDNGEDIKFELLDAVEQGLNAIVEVTNIGMGRNVSLLKKISEDLGINIIASTGFYKKDYYTDFVYESSIEELCMLFVREIEEGIEDTEIKAGILAEIGSSYNIIEDIEKKVFIAAAKAHCKTGASISTHCELGTMAYEQVKLLLNEGVNPDKIIIGHMDLHNDIDELEKILKLNVNIAFDTIGKNNYNSEENRVKNLLTLIDKGYIKNILLSQDITRKSHLKKNNGTGYTYIFDTFIPNLLKVGVENSMINQMLVDTPARILDF